MRTRTRKDWMRLKSYCTAPEERNKKRKRVCEETCWTGNVIAFEAALCTWTLISEKVKKRFVCLSVCESNSLCVSPTSPDCFLFLFLLKHQQSNQDIGDPAVTVMRPCPDGIKSNTSLMPQTLYATAAFRCVDLCLHVCVCVWTKVWLHPTLANIRG